jgi:preprotein translocase subunit SecB
MELLLLARGSRSACPVYPSGGRPCGGPQGYDSHSARHGIFVLSSKSGCKTVHTLLETAPGETFMTNGNGAPPEAAPPPQLNVLAQYTKDLSFENPNAPTSLAPQQQQPAINIQINVSANNIAEHEYEVTLSVEGKAENGGKLMFSFELSYAGVFRILNVPQENLHPLVMIECPRLLFPFAREIIATSVRDGGFPPLMLDPVDFVGLYRQNMERQAAAQAATQAKPS